MASYVLPPTIDGANSHPFVVNKSRGIPAHVTAPGLAGGETVTIQKQAISGDWHNYSLDGEVQRITPSHSGVAVYAPGIYRGVKTATAAQVGVEVSTDINP